MQVLPEADIFSSNPCIVTPSFENAADLKLAPNAAFLSTARHTACSRSSQDKATVHLAVNTSSTPPSCGSTIGGALAATSAPAVAFATVIPTAVQVRCPRSRQRRRAAPGRASPSQPGDRPANFTPAVGVQGKRLPRDHGAGTPRAGDCAEDSPGLATGSELPNDRRQAHCGRCSHQAGRPLASLDYRQGGERRREYYETTLGPF